MINKQKLWFLTLFTLILVLSIYYVTMPTDIVNVTDIEEISVTETDTISVLEELSDEEYVNKINELEKTITDEDTTVDEKNNAYELINIEKENKALQEKLEEKILDEFDLKSCITISGNKIKVVLTSNENSYELANNIIRCIQKEFSEDKEISVQFK